MQNCNRWTLHSLVGVKLTLRGTNHIKVIILFAGISLLHSLLACGNIGGIFHIWIVDLNYIVYTTTTFHMESDNTEILIFNSKSKLSFKYINFWHKKCFGIDFWVITLNFIFCKNLQVLSVTLVLLQSSQSKRKFTSINNIAKHQQIL